MHDEHETTPEWLRELGSEQLAKRRPGSGKLPGQISNSTFKVPQKHASGQAAPSGPGGPDGPDGRKLLSLEALDAIFPSLRLKGYRPLLPWQQEAPSPEQRQYLEAIGIDPDDVTNKGLASRVLDHFRSRRERGLASLRQLLAMIGANVEGAEHVGFEEVKRILAEKYNQRDRGGPHQ